jgi:acyl-CoA dehydrogenase
VQALCATFPPEYRRGLDEVFAYPEAFVNALNEAG